LRVFGKVLMTEILYVKDNEWEDVEGNCIVGIVIICTNRVMS
jgi:hypothetical protein